MARVLVIDDSVMIRQHIARLLKNNSHVVEMATDGQDGLSKLNRHRPELIIVDFVMPKMNGFQFCSALRSISNYKETPVVLLSSRSDEVGERFIERFHVNDAISKPFEDEALLAVAHKALEEGMPGKALKGVPIIARTDRDAAVSSERQVEDRLSKAAERIAELMFKRLPNLGSQKQDIVTALVDGFADDDPLALDELVCDLGAVSARSALSGHTTVFPLYDVMQMMDMQRQTGVLEVVWDQCQASIQFRKGQVEMAVAVGVGPEFMIGRYLVEEGLVSREDFQHLLDHRMGSLLLGEELVKLGRISQEDLIMVLGRQTSDIVIEMFRWKGAKFRLYPDDEMPDAKKIGNRFSVSNLVMEGLRQVDEWRVIEGKIPDFDVIFEIAQTGAMLESSKLSLEEILVFDCVDGLRTVREVIVAVDMGSFVVCKILYRLLSVNLIRQVLDDA
ncbi:MAG: response regulator [Proteobacteria bacterium]|nr:response regulator [Pseudomonadota bacterium]